MNNTRNTISEFYGEDLLMADGFDDCVLGVSCVWSGNSQNNIVIYNKQKMIDKLAKDMSYDEALEYFEFNIQGAYVGPNTPIYCEMLDCNEKEKTINKLRAELGNSPIKGGDVLFSDLGKYNKRTQNYDESL